jgi:hypothetical protein
MMKNYITKGNLARNKKPEGDSAGKAATPCPEEKAIMLIYGGLAPHETWRKLKLISRVIHSMSTAVPKYLHWFESLITFDQMDNPDIIPKLGRFPSSLTRRSGQPGLPRPSWTGAAASSSCTSTPLRD